MNRAEVEKEKEKEVRVFATHTDEISSSLIRS